MSDDQVETTREAIERAAQLLLDGHDAEARQVMHHHGAPEHLVRGAIRSKYGARGALWLANHPESMADGLGRGIFSPVAQTDKVLGKVFEQTARLYEARDLIRRLLDTSGPAHDPRSAIEARADAEEFLERTA